MTKVIPRASLNGTSAQTLIDNRVKVCEAIAKTIAALYENAPHGRDYQHDRTGAEYKLALAIHGERVKWLNELHVTLMDEAEAIDARYPLPR